MRHVLGPKRPLKHKDTANHGFCNHPCFGPENQKVNPYVFVVCRAPLYIDICIYIYIYVCKSS